jgi:hypothetical protein
LKWLLQKQLKVKFVADMVDGKIKFSCVGTLCSGVMNTSLYAVLLMAIALCSVGDDLGLIPGHDYGFMSAGDDTNPMVPAKYYRRFKQRMPEVFRDLGFLLTIDNITTNFAEMDFCQCRPVFDGDIWRMVREPTNARGKDALFVHSVRTEQEWNKARGSIANCGLALCYGMPVMQAYYQHLGQGLDLAAVKRVEDSGMGRMAHGRTAMVKPISIEARVSFWEAFGLEPSAQVALEQLYASTAIVWRPPSEIQLSITNNYLFE